MNKAIPILSVLLVAQIGLSVGLNYLEHSRNNDKGKKILTADVALVDRIVLEEKNRRVTIKKAGKTWTLPEFYNFPAAQESVSRLLEKLKDLNGNWPVATTEDAAPRFKVANTDFQERIALNAGDKNIATILVGSAAGYNKVHLRVDKTTDIFAVELPTREISTESGDWIDRNAVELQANEIDSVELPQLKLKRKDKNFELTYAGKTVTLDPATASEVLEDVAGVNISDVLGRDEKPEYGLTAPVFTFNIGLKNGTRLKYSFGKLSNSNFFVLRKPGGDFYLKIDAWFVDRLRGLSADALAQKSEQLRKLRDSATKQLIEKTNMSGSSKEPVTKP